MKVSGAMDYDTINRYIKYGSPTDPLSAQEEVRLVLRYKKTGDENARRRLIESNLRFVVKLAMKQRQQGLSLSDLIQEGVLGLIESIDKFDPARECRLITYASWWIRLYIQRAIEQKSRQINLPINKLETLRKVRGFERMFVSTRGRQPYVDEIADHLGMDAAKIEQLCDYAPSFQTLHHRDEDHPGMERILIDEEQADARDEIWSEEANARLNEALGSLTPRERDVIRYRFNLNGGGKKKSLRKVGQQLGLSAEGVRRIEEQAMNKLRRPCVRGKMESLFAN
ncbi:MAG: sigma-70 family RNA polymerase sigma factor [bacterium]|nr:sigma-70 family RNA polymerase sigma factor [bacterium]